MQSTYIVNEQHVRIRQHFAGLVPRMVALLADCFIDSAYFFGLSGFLEYSRLYYIMDDWFVFFLFFLPVQFYFLLFELLNNGQTPGKRLMSIRVVRLDGRPLSLSACILRFLLLYVDTMFGLVGALLIVLTPRSQRIGDLAAGTSVVSDRKFRASRVDLSEYAYLLADYRPHYVRAAELSAKQADIIDHALRSAGKNRPQRLAQLCTKVEPICGSRESADVPPEHYLQCVLNDYRFYQLENKDE